MSIEFDFNFDQQEQYVNFSYEHELWSIIYGANGSQTILPALRNITKIQDNESLVWTTVHTLWTSKLLWDTVTQLRFLFYFVLPSETMFASLEQVPRYVTEMFPVFFFAAILENGIRLLQGKRTVRANETVASLSQGIFQECLRIKVRSVEVLMYCLVWNNFRLVTLPWNSLWTWWLCYFAVDLGFYWAHRLAHEVNFIWAIHQAHHSSTEFSIVSALRQAVLQPFTAWFTYMPFALFIPPQIFLAHLQLSELYMAWLHTEVVGHLGPLELVLNTPSHHRVHHSRRPEHIDKNYGGMLIIWDRLFDTFLAEDAAKPAVYGLVHPLKSYNPMTVQFHTWPVIWRRMRRASCWQNKLFVLMKGPGWRPGLPRLGDPTTLPQIEKPVVEYDPQISSWQNAYVCVHFAILLLFYHELTMYQDSFSPMMLNLGVACLLVSITSIGYMIDNKRKPNSLLELGRCVLFFQSRHIVSGIIDQGLKRSGINLETRIIILFAIYAIFAMSVLINMLHVVWHSLDLQMPHMHKKQEALARSSASIKTKFQ